MDAAAPKPLTLDETSARQVLMVRAFESDGADSPQWTAEDRAWATRAARESAGADDRRFLAERARLALQRIRPRSAAAAQLLDVRGWRAGWLLPLALLSMLAGVALDTFGDTQRINLLAPPVWAVVAWNGVVYLALVWQVFRARAQAGPVRRVLLALLRRLGAEPGAPPGDAAVRRYVAAWAEAASPLAALRGASALHLSSAAFAVGLVAGLYLRGIVLDYRAGWQSTFLDAAQVHALLAALLAPAVAASGIGVPGPEAIAALRVGPEAAASGPAAPWIHLFATTLALFVIGPRLALAALAAARSAWRASHLELPVAEPYFAQLLRAARQAPARLHVWPHGGAPSAPAGLALQALFAPLLGESLAMRIETATAYGDEDDLAPRAAAVAATHQVALFDLGATPEAEAQGRFVAALAGPAKRLAVVDEAAFARRFAAFPERRAERRAAWAAWAREHGVSLLCVDLGAAASAAARAELQSLWGEP